MTSQLQSTNSPQRIWAKPFLTSSLQRISYNFLVQLNRESIRMFTGWLFKIERHPRGNPTDHAAISMRTCDSQPCMLYIQVMSGNRNTAFVASMLRELSPSSRIKSTCRIVCSTKSFIKVAALTDCNNCSCHRVEGKSYM